MSKSTKGRCRLYIKEMVMVDFKSFAGEQRVGPFHQSFSAVIGPNGSGKSNVIDAMLFVFGKRSKQMRFNKVSELIYNSTVPQNLNSARVSIHFQEIIDLDDGTYEVVPGSDFVIEREAFRNNSSKYYINSRDSKFTEVTKKLKGKGVDLDNNRFLILQGEVEQISLMKPKAQGPHDEGFLEYLEDIIGTNKYLEKFDEAYTQLESLDKKRSGVVQMVKLAEKERESLEGSKNEAEDYMLKELSLLKWQEVAAKLASVDNTRQIGEMKANISTLEENLKIDKERFQEKGKTLEELEALHTKYLETHEELYSALKRCKDQFKEFERQDVKHHEDLKHVNTKIKKVGEKLEKDSAKISDITKQCEKSMKLILKLEDDIPKLQKLFLDGDKILEEIKESFKVETEMFRSELTKARAELEPWEKQLIEHKGKLEVAYTESKLLAEKHEAGRAAYEDAQKQLDALRSKIVDKTSSKQKFQIELDKNKLEALELRKVEQECLKEQEALVPLEQASRQKVMELTSAMESEKSLGSVLKAILQAKATNEIEGIHGRLGDLGSIHSDYDVAISTACPQLDYILVETTAAAQACVEMLRQRNLGVATFMILEKQTGHLLKMKETVSPPEGKRLFDLVKVDRNDEKMKLAFFAALRNTVVAKDIDQASRIAYGGSHEFRRVVTVKGELFEKSGTMSGGGGTPRGGKIKTTRATSVSGEVISNVSGEDIAKAEKEVSEMVEKLRALRQRISDVVHGYQSVYKSISHLEMKLAKSQIEVDGLNSQLDNLEKQLDSLEAGSRPSKHELDRLEELGKFIVKEENEISKFTHRSKELKRKVSELQTKIENAGGEKLKIQKSKVNQILTDIDKSSTDINYHKVQIDTGQNMIKKLIKGIEDSKREKERLVLKKENLLSNFKEIKQKAFAAEENYKKTQESIGRHRDVLDKTKSKYASLKKTMDELHATEVDANFKLEDMKKILKDLEVKGNKYNKKLKDLPVAISKHMEQIKKDLVDQEKLQATLGDESLSKASDLKRSLETVALLEAQLKEMNPNLDSVAEYRTKVSLYNERVEELYTVTQERDDTQKQYNELKKKRLDEFMAGFNTISLKLKEMYQMITLGGDAELELVDSLDPFSEGVVFRVRPPKKSWKNIANLSGGEKTLSSLALVFALHHYKPTPFYVMDEIDAALDFKNASIVGLYVNDCTKDAQFIIISLRNNMFELADRLVGIYKIENCSKSITIYPSSFC